MTSREEIVIADDGLPMDKVGPWAKEKHQRLQKYVDISQATRRKFLEGRRNSKGAPGGATYVDLFCGYGRSILRDSGEVIDGSPLVAFKSASFSDTAFSEVHVGDTENSKVEAASKRLTAAGATVCPYVGQAIEVAPKVVSALNPHGLHFVFLDPYDLDTLPFSVIEAFASLKRIDMLIHVSAQDLTRNLQLNIQEKSRAFDTFAPGWRDHVNLHQPDLGIRAELFEYWKAKIGRLGISPAYGIEVVRGTKNQRLYWLVFVGRHKLALKFWEAVRDVSNQGSLL